MHTDAPAICLFPHGAICGPCLLQSGTICAPHTSPESHTLEQYRHDSERDELQVLLISLNSFKQMGNHHSNKACANEESSQKFTLDGVFPIYLQLSQPLSHWLWPHSGSLSFTELDLGLGFSNVAAMNECVCKTGKHKQSMTPAH